MQWSLILLCSVVLCKIFTSSILLNKYWLIIYFKELITSATSYVYSSCCTHNKCSYNCTSSKYSDSCTSYKWCYNTTSSVYSSCCTLNKCNYCCTSSASICTSSILQPTGRTLSSNSLTSS